MNETKSTDPIDPQIKEAVWSPKKKHFSVVWIVPIVALLIGASLIWQNLSQRGPTIEISFKSASGITAGKSVIKYKDITVGKVQKIRFSDDLSSVIVTAELNKEMRPYLRKGTRFWIVHARLTAESIEGLDTLLSGAYIAMDPAREGEKTSRFVGLENPPILLNGHRGRRFVLEADSKGSLQIGSPVYYKKIKAGTVTSYRLAPNRKRVLIDIFVEKPYSDLVRTTTRFWNASGIEATIGTQGVEIRTESLTALLSGGVAFDNFGHFGPGKPVKENHHFVLFDSYKQAKKVVYQREIYFWVYFDESIRGLKVGSPVEFRGVKVGEVVNFFLEGDAETGDFKIPILFKLQPERFNVEGTPKNGEDRENLYTEIFKKLVARGFRAQLQSSSLLTGDLLINLDFHPNAKPARLVKENGLYVFPSIPATMESLKNNLQSILQDLAAIPFKEIGQSTLRILDQVKEQTLPGINSGIKQFENELMPALSRLITQGDRTLKEVRRTYLDTNAEIHRKMLKLLDEITKTSRSIRHLSDYLERHPESIIRGK